jgi:hypothetical protein
MIPGLKTETKRWRRLNNTGGASKDKQDMLVGRKGIDNVKVRPG